MLIIVFFFFQFYLSQNASQWFGIPNGVGVALGVKGMKASDAFMANASADTPVLTTIPSAHNSMSLRQPVSPAAANSDGEDGDASFNADFSDKNRESFPSFAFVSILLVGLSV
jgi:hypothetical protein